MKRLKKYVVICIAIVLATAAFLYLPVVEIPIPSDCQVAGSVAEISEALPDNIGKTFERVAYKAYSLIRAFPAFADPVYCISGWTAYSCSGLAEVLNCCCQCRDDGAGDWEGLWCAPLPGGSGGDWDNHEASHVCDRRPTPQPPQPTNTPASTSTPVPTPTNTPIPPTNTPIPPTNTPIPPATSTSVAPPTSPPKSDDNDQYQVSGGLDDTCYFNFQSFEQVASSGEVDIIRISGLNVSTGELKTINLTDDNRLGASLGTGAAGWNSISPNMCYMVFVYQELDSDASNLWVVHTNGPQVYLHEITKNQPAEDCADYPQWADNNKIVYTNTCDGFVYETNFSGSVHTRLDFSLNNLEVLPDGSRLMGNKPNGDLELRDFSSDSVALPITGQGVWYPDGSSLYVFEDTKAKELDLTTGELSSAGSWDNLAFDPRDNPQYSLGARDGVAYLVKPNGEEIQLYASSVYSPWNNDLEHQNPSWEVASGLLVDISHPSFEQISQFADQLSVDSKEVLPTPTLLPTPTKESTKTPTETSTAVPAPIEEAQKTDSPSVIEKTVNAFNGLPVFLQWFTFIILGVLGLAAGGGLTVFIFRTRG